MNRVGFAPHPAVRWIIGVLVVGFCAYWLLRLAVIFLPAFLTQAFGYTPIQAGWIMMLVSLGQIVILPGVSSVSDSLKRRGVSSGRCGAGRRSGDGTDFTRSCESRAWAPAA